MYKKDLQYMFIEETKFSWCVVVRTTARQTLSSNLPIKQATVPLSDEETANRWQKYCQVRQNTDQNFLGWFKTDLFILYAH